MTKEKTEKLIQEAWDILDQQQKMLSGVRHEILHDITFNPHKDAATNAFLEAMTSFKTVMGILDIIKIQVKND